jgi:hypothetical protein
LLPVAPAFHDAEPVAPSPTAAAQVVARPPALMLPEGRTHGRLLAALLPWLARGGRIYCLDGGNAFAPYKLAAAAAQAGLDPADVLERVFVSRAYTCHQLVEATETMLAAPAAERPAPLAIVLQVDRLFHDEDIPLHERRSLFDRIVGNVGRLHRDGLPLLLTLTPERPNPWVAQLARVATITADMGRSLRAITGTISTAKPLPQAIADPP